VLNLKHGLSYEGQLARVKLYRTLLGQHCWELLRLFARSFIHSRFRYVICKLKSHSGYVKLRANGCNDSQECLELQCLVRRIPVSNYAQQLPTTCKRICKRTQHVTSNNVWSCWAIMLRPFARGLKGLCHGSPVHFVWFCQLLALNRYGT